MLPPKAIAEDHSLTLFLVNLYVFFSLQQASEASLGSNIFSLISLTILPWLQDLLKSKI